MSMQSTATTSRAQPYPAATGRVRRHFLRPLLLAGAALALFAPPLLPSAHAGSLPPLVVQAQQALKNAQSWKMTIVDASNGSVRTITITVVRHGATIMIYYVATTGQGTVEGVFGGTRTCVRMNHQGPWNCAIPSTSSAVTNALNQALTLNVPNLQKLNFRSAGARVVLGQLCMGYTITGSGSSERGTFWINASNKRPVRITDTRSQQSTFTVTWSNWNDPSLTIPNVGA